MRPVLRRLAIAGIVTAFAALPQAAGAVSQTISGTISSASSSRSSSVQITAPSNCSAVPSAAAVSNGPYHYDAYTFDSSFGSQCVSVGVNSATGQGVLVTAYAIGTNYTSSPGSIIGTSGTCLPDPDETLFSFTSPASGFILVVEECASGTGGTYSITVTAGAVAARLLGAPTAAPSARGTSVRWRPATEVGVVAYNVYRQVNGHRVRANARPIPAAGRRAYTFVDRRAGHGARVRYWIQAVRADGSCVWLGHTRVLRV
jgi:hypothetical protein